MLIGYLDKNAEKMRQLLKDKNVLELGAGTGIVGLSAMAFGPSLMVLTDFEENLKILEVNAHLNFPT